MGDNVVALVPGGGYAAFCLAHESHALPLPPGLTAIEGAGLPETTFTVWHNVFERGGLVPTIAIKRAADDVSIARQGLRLLPA